MAWGRVRATIIRRRCEKRSTISIVGSTTTLTTGYIKPVSPPASRPTMKPLTRCLPRSNAEQILGQHRYLTGNQLTEADIRLWTTLVRFDPVYVTHFKCDKAPYQRLSQPVRFPARYLPDAGIAETVNFPHIRNHYYRSQNHQPDGDHLRGPAAGSQRTTRAGSFSR